MVGNMALIWVSQRPLEGGGTASYWLLCPDGTAGGMMEHLVQWRDIFGLCSCHFALIEDEL